MLQEPAALALLHVKPVNSSAFISENLLEVSNGKGLSSRRARFISKAPDGIDVLVLRNRLQELRYVAGDDVNRSSGQIARIEKLVQIARDQRIRLRRHRDHRVPRRQQR